MDGEMRDRKHFSPHRDRAWGGRAAAVLPMCYSGVLLLVSPEVSCLVRFAIFSKMCLRKSHVGVRACGL